MGVMGLLWFVFVKKKKKPVVFFLLFCYCFWCFCLVCSHAPPQTNTKKKIEKNQLRFIDKRKRNCESFCFSNEVSCHVVVVVVGVVTVVV